MVSFHQFAQLGRLAAAFVRCLALLVVKQPHRGVFVVPDRLRPFENAPREVDRACSFSVPCDRIQRAYASGENLSPHFANMLP